MDLKSVRRFQETVIRNEDSSKTGVHYNEKTIEDFLQTLKRIETKIDVLLMQKK
ncbi:hypothetical protein KHA93_19760 [Bacillus sp. FJAT-49732]|uniref:Uncharacterized protein n=1 Tax=Lederbergia citrisecunda TaxID=2833583 RepID=A0A942YNL5_9BACI|nr:hypothetical protein [Lederbergia citrisecunda]MBS4201845.1 hypothetical protein [Lederbergia citrisecunda]